MDLLIPAMSNYLLLSDMVALHTIVVRGSSEVRRGHERRLACFWPLLVPRPNARLLSQRSNDCVPWKGPEGLSRRTLRSSGTG